MPICRLLFFAVHIPVAGRAKRNEKLINNDQFCGRRRYNLRRAHIIIIIILIRGANMRFLFSR